MAEVGICSAKNYFHKFIYLQGKELQIFTVEDGSNRLVVPSTWLAFNLLTLIFDYGISSNVPDRSGLYHQPECMDQGIWYSRNQ